MIKLKQIVSLLMLIKIAKINKLIPKIHWVKLFTKILEHQMYFLILSKLALWLRSKVDILAQLINVILSRTHQVLANQVWLKVG